MTGEALDQLARDTVTACWEGNIYRGHYTATQFVRAALLRGADERAALQEFFDAQTAFDAEDEDHDRRRWAEAGARLERARAAVEALR